MKDIKHIKGIVKLRLPDGSVKEFKNSEDAQKWYNDNYGNKYHFEHLKSYKETRPSGEYKTSLPELVITPKTTSLPVENSSSGDPIRDGIFEGRYGNRTFTPTDKNIQYYLSLYDKDKKIKEMYAPKEHAKLAAIAGAGAAGVLGAVYAAPLLTNPYVTYGLGAYGVGNGFYDMSQNGVNAGNVFLTAASALPYAKFFTKIPGISTVISKGKSLLPRQVTLFFNKDAIIAKNEALKRLNNRTYSGEYKDLVTRIKRKGAFHPFLKYLLSFRNNAPKVGNFALNTVQDMSNARNSNQLMNYGIQGLNNVWNYDVDSNGNVTNSFNNDLKDITNYSLLTLSSLYGFGARSGNNAGNLLTGTLAWGPGSYYLNRGLNAVENNYNLKDNVIWNTGRYVTENVAPAIFNGLLNKGLSTYRYNLGKDLTLHDLRNLNTTMRDITSDEIIATGLGTFAYPVNSTIASYVTDDLDLQSSMTSFLTNMQGHAINHRRLTALALQGSAGALKYNGRTIINTIDNILGYGLNTKSYTGRYHDGDANVRSNRQGGLYGVEARTGYGKDRKKGSKTYGRWLPVFGGYNQSNNKNFGEFAKNAPEINWWNLHSGLYIPKEGEQFGIDSKVVRYGNNNSGNDQVSRMARGNNRPVVEIRSNSKLFGDANVPENVSVATTFGISRSDGLFQGPSGLTLNTVGANGVFYKDNNGMLDGIQIVDYTNPGVRRISSDNKFVRWLAHPFNSSKRNVSDNYYNSPDPKNPNANKNRDLLYLTTSWATSLAEGLLRQQVFNTTGYLKLDNMNSDIFKPISSSIFGTKKNKKEKDVNLVSYSDITGKKGTSADRLKKFKENLNAIYNSKGNSWYEKYLSWKSTQ